MKTRIALILLSAILSGCSLFQTHKVSIEQGNTLAPQDVSRLHTGMSTQQVKAIMGTPLLVNLFTPNRLAYVYTFQAGHGERKTQRVTCLFSHDRLQEIIRH